MGHQNITLITYDFIQSYSKDKLDALLLIISNFLLVFGLIAFILSSVNGKLVNLVK